MAFKLYNSPFNCWKGYRRDTSKPEFSKGSCVKSSPAKKKQKGGGTSKTCLPAAKIANLSTEKKKDLLDKI